MKAILEFDLNDQDDILAHMRCTVSTDMAIVLWQLVHNTRRSIENKIDNAIEQDNRFTPYDSLELIYDELHRLLTERNIEPDKLIV